MQRFSSWRHRLLYVLAFTGTATAACGSDNSLDSPASVLDSDKDGLGDQEELRQYGTSPILADTDGDGLDDYTEIVEYGHDRAVDPFRFNPLVADLPDVGIRLTSPVEPFMTFTDARGVERRFTTTRSRENATTISSSSETSDALRAERSISNSITGGGKVSTSDVEISGSATYTDTRTGSRELTFTNTEGQSEENRQTLSQAEEYARTNEITQSSGGLMCTLMLENRGNLAFRVKNLIVAAHRVDLETEDLFHPIGNLILDTNEYLAFPEFTISPGVEVGPIPFINDHLDLATARSVFADTKSVKLVPAIVELTDAEGTPFNFRFTDVTAKTAHITIDYGGHPASESYLVATNARPEAPGITAREALATLGIPHSVGSISWNGKNSRGLLGVRDSDPPDETTQAQWVTVHRRKNGVDMAGTGYGLDEPYDFDAIELRAGDELQLLYIEDKDRDRLFARAELLRGTSDEERDTDGDGLDDFDEMDAGLDPSTNDTDGDQLLDRVDPDPSEPNSFHLSAGKQTTALIKADGSLWHWGDYFAVRLSEPTRVGDSEDWAQVSVGELFGVSIKREGTLWAWGPQNANGQLGQGNTLVPDADAPNFAELISKSFEPVRIQPDSDWMNVSASDVNVLAIKTSGQLWAWGGIGAENSWARAASPIPVGADDVPWVAVANGGATAAALQSGQSLWLAGDPVCSYEASEIDEQTGERIQWTVNFPPRSYSFFQFGAHRDWVKVSMGRGSSWGLGIRADGTLYSWGNNHRGQLGRGDPSPYPDRYCELRASNLAERGPQGDDGDEPAEYLEPVAISTGWLSVATGLDHALGIRSDGTLWSWGGNDHGQLGLKYLSEMEPRPVQLDIEGPWVQVAAGSSHSVAIRADGTVWAWGENGDGELGIGTIGEDVPEPTCVTSVIPGEDCG